MYKVIGADGRVYGPVTTEEVRQWIAEGRANSQTRIQAEEGGEWKTVADFPELLAAAPGVPPTLATARVQAVVPNYLVWSIIMTICCCPPFGIPAIVYSAQVNTKLAAGDLVGAQTASRKARMWCWVAFAMGMVSNIVSACLMPSLTKLMQLQ